MTPQGATDDQGNEIINPFANLKLLASLAPSKSYRSYSKQQQDDVISYIKDGNSLRKAEKVFGIPKSTMHCWLKKIHKDLTSELEKNPVLFESNSSHIRCSYSRQLKDDVIGFVKDGNNLGTAKKVFGIPRSTMHHWLKKSFYKSDLFVSENIELESGDKNGKVRLEENGNSEKRKRTQVEDQHLNTKPSTKTNSQIVLNELENLNENQVKIISCHNTSKQHKIKRLKYNVQIIGSMQTPKPLVSNNIKTNYETSKRSTSPAWQKGYTDHDYDHQYQISDHDYYKVH